MLRTFKNQQTFRPRPESATKTGYWSAKSCACISHHGRNHLQNRLTYFKITKSLATIRVIEKLETANKSWYVDKGSIKQQHGWPCRQYWRGPENPGTVRYLRYLSKPKLTSGWADDGPVEILMELLPRASHRLYTAEVLVLRWNVPPGHADELLEYALSWCSSLRWVVRKSCFIGSKNKLQPNRWKIMDDEPSTLVLLLRTSIFSCSISPP